MIGKVVETGTRHVPLRTFGSIERDLKWGWTVRCRLLKIQFPVGGVELTVEDVRRPLDPLGFDDWEPREFEVLTLQGWHNPTAVWAVRAER